MHAAASAFSEAPSRCVVCGADSAAPKRARIRSNVQRFSEETFAVWQCRSCASVHAAEEVDLDFYYAHYPFHAQSVNAGTRLMFANKLRGLTRLGLKREQRVLDYGCGGGAFVTYLRDRGFTQARGYDAYVREGPFSKPPGRGYDFVHSQDVIEHVADPREHLATMRELVNPGGLVVLGTPNAAVIDLDDPEEFIHVLHQPYHRHILSPDALSALARELAMEVVEVKLGFFGNLAIPGMNGRFLRRVLRTHGDTIDAVVTGNARFDWRLLAPAAIWDAFTGSFRDAGYDMQVALRLPS